MIKVNFCNDYEFDFNAKRIVNKIAKKIAKEEKLKGKYFLSIILVDLENIQKVNKDYRGIDAPTDVISFAAIDGEEFLPEEMGDIFICYEKILEQSQNYGHSVLREFSFLVTHGIYHLLGYDHMTKEDEKEMFDKQEKILELLKIGR